MNKLLLAIIALFIIVALVLGGYQVYGMGHDRGEQAGYDTGYTIGHDEGYQTGQSDGYREGYETGNEEGIATGKKLGYTEGYEVGQEDGYQSGYNSGLTVGLQTGYDDGYGEGDAAGYERGLNDLSRYGYTIRDATFAEVIDFLARDRTDEKQYILESYVCSHFARDVCNNAEAAGIRCAAVELRYAGSGHMIVAFNTIDQGLVYFESQSDEQANPAIGLRYYTTIIPDPGYYYTAPDFDDTILDMVVIW